MYKLLSYSFTKVQINWIILGIISLNLALHVQVLDLDIQGVHAWRQCQTMWNIKNFTDSDPNILNPRVSHFNFGDTNIYRYEFPIMQWTIGMTQRLLGEHVILVRLMLFLITSIGSIGFYKLLRRMAFSVTSALAGLIFFLFSPVVFYYMINPLPDNLALAAIIWYIYHIVSYQKIAKRKHLIWASVCLLLATLAKLPFLMLSIVSIYFFVKDLMERKKSIVSLLAYGTIQFLILFPALVWYYWVMPGWEGNGVLKGIFDDKTDWTNNLDILKYHTENMFPLRLLYASVWIPFIIGLYFAYKRLAGEAWVYVMVFITSLYLLLQWDVIGKAHDYYLMPFLLWMYILVTIGIEKLLDARSKIWKTLGLILILSAPLVSYYVSIDKWYSVWYNRDLYTHREALRAAVPNDAKCIMLKDISKYVFPYQVNKKGYIYQNESLPGKWVKNLISKHEVKYLYSDSRKFEQKEDISPLLDSLILEAGSIRVYGLKGKDE